MNLFPIIEEMVNLAGWDPTCEGNIVKGWTPNFRILYSDADTERGTTIKFYRVP